MAINNFSLAEEVSSITANNIGDLLFNGVETSFADEPELPECHNWSEGIDDKGTPFAKFHFTDGRVVTATFTVEGNDPEEGH